MPERGVETLDKGGLDGAGETEYHHSSIDLIKAAQGSTLLNTLDALTCQRPRREFRPWIYCPKWLVKA